MTYLKTTSISMALAAVLGATSAFAGETPPTFVELDANANGQVSFSEFATQMKANGEALTSAQRQFNVISGGAQSFTAEQYENSFTVKGDIKAGETDSLVVMPSESTAVKGAVEANETLDATPQVKSDKAMDNEAMDDEAMEEDSMESETSVDMDTSTSTEIMEDDSMKSNTMESDSMREPSMEEPAMVEPTMEKMDSETMEDDVMESDPMQETETMKDSVTVKMDSEMNSATDMAIDPMLESESKMDTEAETNMSLDTDTTLDTDTPLDIETSLDEKVMSDTETTIDSPQVEDSELNIDPTEEAVQPESDTSYDTEFSLPDVPEKPVLDDAESNTEIEARNETDSDITVEENQGLEEPEIDLDIKSDVETDLEANPDE